METKKMPVHTVRLGKIQASIWENQTKHGPRYNVTAHRLYLDEGDWKRSESFGRDELLAASHAFMSAYDWIWAQSKALEGEAAEEAI